MGQCGTKSKASLAEAPACTATKKKSSIDRALVEDWLNEKPYLRPPDWDSRDVPKQSVSTSSERPSTKKKSVDRDLVESWLHEKPYLRPADWDSQDVPKQ